MAAAYILVLQGTFALAAAAEMPALESTIVFCASHTADNAAGDPVSHDVNCCLACTLALGITLPPSDASALIAPLAFVPAQAFAARSPSISIADIRTGQARAPPPFI